jgi:hypothetical protein
MLDAPSTAPVHRRTWWSRVFGPLHLSDRSHIQSLLAIVIIVAFAFAALFRSENTALTALKEVCLVVVGFYFGAGAAQQRTPDHQAPPSKVSAPGNPPNVRGGDSISPLDAFRPRPVAGPAMRCDISIGEIL